MNQREEDFFRAVQQDRVTDVVLMLEHSPELAKTVDEKGNTALQFVPSVEMVSALVCSGVDPGKENKEGIFPDETAQKKGLIEIVGVLRRSWKESARG